MCKAFIIIFLLIFIFEKTYSQELPDHNSAVFELNHWDNEGHSLYSGLRLDSIKKRHSYFGEFVGTFSFLYDGCTLASSCYNNSYDDLYWYSYDTCTYYNFSKAEGITIINESEETWNSIDYNIHHTVDSFNQITKTIEKSSHDKGETIITTKYNENYLVYEVRLASSYSGATTYATSDNKRIIKYDSINRKLLVLDNNSTTTTNPQETRTSCRKQSFFYNDEKLDSIIVLDCNSDELISFTTYSYDSLLEIKTTVTYSINGSSASPKKEETLFDSQGNIKQIKKFDRHPNRWELRYEQFNDDQNKPVSANYYQKINGEFQISNIREWCYNNHALELITDNGKITEMYFFSEIDSDCKVTELQQNPSTCLFDADNDGFYASHDCDDSNPNIHPDLEEIVYNGDDDDCDPYTADDDLDHDGYNLEEDCDDNDKDINPGVLEIAYNGIDDDCDPTTLDDDLDEDGYVMAEDCDDDNPGINPAAEELPNNGIDEDCDGMDLISSTDNQLIEMGLSVFPNPARDYINISISSNISIYTSSGQLIHESKNVARVDVSALEPGVYFLKVQLADRMSSKVYKVVIL